ncbi:MAG: hypothetical protein H6692_03465 [Gemmatimonadales bacterium]|nr:hypothetical protein [Gemmatimonadales bacterium]
MRLRPLCCLLALALPITPTGAQDVAVDTTAVVCPDSLSPRGLRVCTAGLDGVAMLHPFAALLSNGGNPRLGSARAIGSSGTLPRLPPHHRTDGDPRPRLRRGRRHGPGRATVQFYAPHLDLAAGLAQMVMPMGTVGIDVLLSALFVPENRTTAFTVVPGSNTIGGASVSLDWGLRFAFEGEQLPVVSLSIMRRTTPQVRLGGTTDGNTTAYTFNAKAIDVRLFVGKRFGNFEIAAGAGADLLSGSGEVAYVDPETDEVGPPLEPDLSGLRLTTALDVGIHAGPLQFVVEGGYRVGSNLGLTTRFAEVDPNAGRFFGSFRVVVTM